MAQFVLNFKSVVSVLLGLNFVSFSNHDLAFGSEGFGHFIKTNSFLAL
jgi:hypothetical protein